VPTLTLILILVGPEASWAKSVDPECANLKPISDAEQAEFENYWDSIQNQPELRLELIYGLLYQRNRVSDTFIQRVLQDPDHRLAQAIVQKYEGLKPDVVAYLLGQDDVTIANLFLNRCVVLNSAQIDALIARQIDPPGTANSTDYISRALAYQPYFSLTPEQAKRLTASTDLIVRIFLATRYGQGDALALSKQMLRSQASIEGVSVIMSLWNPTPSELVDMIISLPDEEIRAHFSMQGKFMPTAEQQDKMLNDPNPEVQIGLLRRKDITLSHEQITKGVQTDNDDLGFWYWGRPEFQPTDAQIDEALRSPRVLKRRYFAIRDGYVLNAARLERGLTDPDSVVRSAFVSQTNLNLTDVQLDRCTQDQDFSVRARCVARKDYSLTQSRFELMLRDANPNLIHGFLNSARSRGTLDIQPFVKATLAGGDPQLIKALSKYRIDLGS
jgi:hypothetical protein